MTLRLFVERGRFDQLLLGMAEQEVRGRLGEPTQVGVPDRRGRVHLLRYDDLELGLAESMIRYMSIILDSRESGDKLMLPTNSEGYRDLRSRMTPDELVDCVGLPPTSRTLDAIAWPMAVAYVQGGIVEKIVASELTRQRKASE
jgi:hypothetical protein